VACGIGLADVRLGFDIAPAATPALVRCTSTLPIKSAATVNVSRL
jgi:hypothetical protein